MNTILKINTDNYKGIHFEDTNQNQSVYIGENLNIQILPSILHNNNKIINQYTDKFIRSIRKIDKYKIDKFKMTFDAIQDISKDNNDINIDINRITETLSTVSINDNMIINNINVYENSDIDELLNKLDI